MPEPAQRTAPPPAADVDALHGAIMRILDDDQAIEVITIPLAGKLTIADHLVFASVL